MREGPLSQRPSFVFFDGNDVDRDMHRSGVVLQSIQDRPSIAIGQLNVESDRRGIVFVR